METWGTFNGNEILSRGNDQLGPRVGEQKSKFKSEE